MNKNDIILKRILIVVLAVILTGGVYVLGYFTFKWTLSPTERDLLKILETYDKHYYFKSDNVLDEICDAILDDYSEYYTPEEYENVVNSNLGKNVGVGLSFYSGTNIIYDVIVNSPCYDAGVEAGGKVISATSKNMGCDEEHVLEFLEDLPIGSHLNLDIDYSGTIKRYNVVKKEYNRSYVTYKNSEGTFVYRDNSSEMLLTKVNDENILKNGVGYIKYEAFSGRKTDSYGSVSQMRTALEKFKNDGNKTLILDLRNNLGGYMDIFSKIAGMLVEKHSSNQVAYKSVTRDGAETLHYISDSVYDSYGFEKIIVLANKYTASASETLIGTMLDYDTQNKVSVIIEGQEKDGQALCKTYGKGIMQTTYRYPDNSAIKLTTAKVLWPTSNKCIHGEGITDKTSEKVINAVNVNAYDYALEIA